MLLGRLVLLWVVVLFCSCSSGMNNDSSSSTTHPASGNTTDEDSIDPDLVVQSRDSSNNVIIGTNGEVAVDSLILDTASDHHPSSAPQEPVEVVTITEDNYLSIFLHNIKQHGFHALPMPCHITLRFMQCQLKWNMTSSGLRFIDPKYHAYQSAILHLFPIHTRLAINLSTRYLPKLLCISQTNCNVEALARMQTVFAAYATANWYEYLVSQYFQALQYAMYYSIQQAVITQQITWYHPVYASYTRELLELTNIPLMQQQLFHVAILLTPSSLIGKNLPGQDTSNNNNNNNTLLFRRDFYRPSLSFLQSLVYELEDMLHIAAVEVVYGYGFVDADVELVEDNCKYVRDYLQQHPHLNHNPTVLLPVHCLMPQVGQSFSSEDSFHLDARVVQLQFVQQLYAHKEPSITDYFVMALEVDAHLDQYYQEGSLDRSEATTPADFHTPEALRHATDVDVHQPTHWTQVLRTFHTTNDNRIPQHVKFRSGWLFALMVPLLHTRLTATMPTAGNTRETHDHVGISFHLCPRSLSFNDTGMSMHSTRLFNFALHSTHFTLLQQDAHGRYGLQLHASKASNDYRLYSMYTTLQASYCLDNEILQEPPVAGGAAMFAFYRDLNHPQSRHIVTDPQVQGVEDMVLTVIQKLLYSSIYSTQVSNYHRYLQHMLHLHSMCSTSTTTATSTKTNVNSNVNGIDSPTVLQRQCKVWMDTLQTTDPLLLTSSYPGSKKGSHPLPPITAANTPKVAVITAVYGTTHEYEKTLKPFAYQTITTDFIAFTDNPHFQRHVTNGWNVDLTPYHYLSLEEDLQQQHQQTAAKLQNSLLHNQHPFNIAKFYKTSFHKIPTLQDYEVVIWIDGTIAITNHTMAEQVLRIMTEKDQDILVFEHIRKGKLLHEVIISAFLEKYLKTSWLGVSQPVQNITEQYFQYTQVHGYSDEYWKVQQQTRPHYGVWCTCFVAFRMWKEIIGEDGKIQKVPNQRVRAFLDLWYTQIKTYSTQDQVSFPFALQKSGLFPYSLPDEDIHGTMDFNSLYLKLDHGM